MKYPRSKSTDVWRKWAIDNYEKSYAASVITECMTDDDLRFNIDKGIECFHLYLSVLDNKYEEVCNA